MPPLIVLAVVSGLPLALLAGLRIKPLYAFVSIVTGYFWVQYLGDSAELAVSSVVHIAHPEVMIRLGLLLLPFILTCLLMRKTLSTSSLPFQFFLLVADSILLATLVIPLLTAGMQGAIYQTHAGNIFRQAHDVAIASIAGLHLLVMYAMRPRHQDAHGSKHHSK